MNKQEYGIIPNLSNEEYHTFKGFLSSSRIKTILQSPELYFKTYLKKEPIEHIDAFDTGTAIHARILEPGIYANTVTFFTGTRRGKEWDKFKEANVDKVILGDMQKLQVDRMYNSYLNSVQATSMITGGEAELSLYTHLHDHDIQVRADYINVEEGKIFDLKSSSGIIDDEKFRYNAEGKAYAYDLQAALYVDAYSKHFNKPFQFFWIVMSKDFDSLKIYEASSEFLEQGRVKYKKGLDLIDQYEAANWLFKETVTKLYPYNSFLGEI